MNFIKSKTSKDKTVHLNVIILLNVWCLYLKSPEKYVHFCSSLCKLISNLICYSAPWWNCGVMCGCTTQQGLYWWNFTSIFLMFSNHCCNFIGLSWPCVLDFSLIEHWGVVVRLLCILCHWNSSLCSQLLDVWSPFFWYSTLYSKLLPACLPS